MRGDGQEAVVPSVQAHGMQTIDFIIGAVSDTRAHIGKKPNKTGIDDVELLYADMLEHNLNALKATALPETQKFLLANLMVRKLLVDMKHSKPQGFFANAFKKHDLRDAVEAALEDALLINKDYLARTQQKSLGDTVFRDIFGMLQTELKRRNLRSDLRYSDGVNKPNVHLMESSRSFYEERFSTVDKTRQQRNRVLIDKFCEVLREATGEIPRGFAEPGKTAASTRPPAAMP